MMDRLSFVALFLVLVGCSSSGPSAKTKEVFGSFDKMESFYGQYTAKHNGQPPKDEQAFREFLKSKQDDLAKNGLTVDQMFVSPRNGEPFQWVYGKSPPPNPAGMTYVGYEKTPVDGKYFAIMTRGGQEELDEAKFRTVFPSASK